MQKPFYSYIALIIFYFFGSIACNTKNKTSVAEFLNSTTQEENKKARLAWEKARYADPETGEIPKGIHWQEQAFMRNFNSKAASMRQTLDTTVWTARGPYNVGGRTRTFVVDVTNPNVFLAGGVSGGIWRSTDSGNSWQRVSNPLDHPGIVSIAQDTRPGFTNRWYALSGEIYGTSASADGAFYLGDGMFSSTDGGLTWVPVAVTAGGSATSFASSWQGGWRCAVNPSNGDVFAALYGGIVRSSDGGATWTSELGGLSGGYFSDISISSSGVSYVAISSDGAGTGRGLWRSADGLTWFNITPSSFPANYDRYTMAIDPNNENNVYFLGMNIDTVGHKSTSYDGDPEWHGLWKYTYLSGDGTGAGGTWTDLSLSLPNDPTSQFDKFYAQGGYDLFISVMPGDSNKVFIGGTNLIRSDNAFADATQNTQIGGYGIGTSIPWFTLYPNHHPDQHGVAFDPSNPQRMYSYCDGGIYKTENALASNVVWDKLNRGYQTTQFYTIALDHHRINDLLFGGLQDNGTFLTRTSNYTDSWDMPYNGDGSYCHVSSDNVFYFSRQQGQLVKCKLDANNQITEFARIDPDNGLQNSDYLWMNPLVVDPLQEGIIYWLGKNKIYRHRNIDLVPMHSTLEYDKLSDGWMVIGDTLTTPSLVFTSLKASSSQDHPHRLYAGTSSGKVYRIDNANTNFPITTNISATSVSLHGIVFPPSGYVADIAVDPNNADKVMVVFSNYSIQSLFYTENGGSTWRNVGGNLETDIAGVGGAPSLRCAAICPTINGNKFYVGTSVGLFSNDTLFTTTTWNLESPNTIGQTVVSAIDHRPWDGKVVVATHGNGVFETHIPSVWPVSINEPNPIKDYSVFPNPTSNILYVKSTESSLPELYDLNGKKITIEGNTVKISNQLFQHQIQVKFLNNGVYFIRNKSGETTKFIKN